MPGGSAGEERFWAAVEGQDRDQVAAALGTGADEVAAVLPALAAWRRRDRDSAAADGWRYRVAWEPVTGLPAAVLAGTWLAVLPQDDPGGTAAAWAQALAGHGARVVTVTADAAAGREELAAAGPGRCWPGRSARPWRGTAAVAGAGAGRPGGAVRCWAGAGAGAGAVLVLVPGTCGDIRGGAGAGAGWAWSWPGWCRCWRWTGTRGRSPRRAGRLAGTLGLVQALGDAGAGARLWVLTRGAVAAGPGEVPVSLAGAQVWGLGRVAALEHPDRWGGLADLPRWLRTSGRGGGCARCWPGAAARTRSRSAVPGCWPAAWSGPRSARPGAARVTGRSRGGRMARCWSPAGPVRWAGMSPAGWPGRVRGTWCWPRGAARPPPGRRGSRPAWPPPGRAVTVTACDAASRSQLAGVLAGVPSGLPLTGVVHAAGVAG